MWSRCKPRSAYDVLAVVGCFAALTTGGAYAANTIGSADIIDGEVKAVDIGQGQVLGSRITDETIKSADLANNQVKGADVDESSLAIVPRAATVPDRAITAAKLADPEGWHYIGDQGEPAFANGWKNYSSEAASHPEAAWPHAAYRKDLDGVVHLTGMIDQGQVGAIAFTLPNGYCPWHYNAYPVLSNNELGRITIEFQQDGCVVRVSMADVNSDTNTAEWVSLSGIQWMEAAIDRGDANR